ncbi:Inositol polyphosphate 5-phosphatase OCRL-1 [Hypsibius exemplaris]|uniref:Inositol polyphosphate 5-phosphatase OCRL-1 n=1 Tax=Hypsibius exemplaris TaxID=2072580 RepID=A0A1W0WVT3_HYPEX|nr:Inositol polyphosphate 5-phosphatase OCRL-1 [Hypsibius exemplaris]
MSANGVLPSRVEQLKSRELLVEERMHLRQKEYVNIQSFHFFLATWNVNGQSPSATESLEPWLTACTPETPTFYVIGFQELDLDKRAYVIETSLREQEWQRTLEAALRKKAAYKLVRVIRLVGMMLLVYVLEKHAGHVKNVAAAHVGTGIMGWMGNKGGVGIRLEFHGSELCFVSAHFAAHTEEVERRNEDFRNICERMVFNQLQFPKRIKDHDIIMWLGDFNYRIFQLSRPEVQQLISEDRLADLVLYDQLQREMSQQKVFHGFREGRIRFRPTYKYDVGTDRWDSSEKSRVPSWCDRILWKAKDGEEVRQVVYGSAMELRLSDHKPVIGIFDVGVKVVDKSRQKKVYENVLKEIDREENLFIPQATIDCNDFDLGELTFVQQVTRTLTVANNGQVPVVFEFIAKPHSTSYCQEWLKITPQRSFLSQGDVCYVELQVYVDKRTVAGLTSGATTLDDILVLHLDGGKDFFITLHGQYRPSCFGIPLETLAAMPTAVRAPPPAITEQTLISFDNSPTTPSTTSLPVDPHRTPAHIPVEVWMMLRHLYAVSSDIPDLFLQPGPPDEVEKIRDHLDGRLPLPLPGSGHSVAEALLLYFDSLPDPLVPYRLYHECLDAGANWSACRFVLEKFPKAHRETFKAFIVLLRKLQRHWDQHPSSDVGTLEVIADLVLKLPVELSKALSGMGQVGKGVARQAISRKKTAFLQQFLINRLDDEPIIPAELTSPATVVTTFPVTFD